MPRQVPCPALKSKSHPSSQLLIKPCQPQVWLLLLFLHVFSCWPAHELLLLLFYQQFSHLRCFWVIAMSFMHSTPSPYSDRMVGEKCPLCLGNSKNSWEPCAKGKVTLILLQISKYRHRQSHVAENAQWTWESLKIHLGLSQVMGSEKRRRKGEATLRWAPSSLCLVQQRSNFFSIFFQFFKFSDFFSPVASWTPSEIKQLLIYPFLGYFFDDIKLDHIAVTAGLHDTEPVESSRDAPQSGGLLHPECKTKQNKMKPTEST